MKLFSSLTCFDVEEQVLSLLIVDPDRFPRAIEDALARSTLVSQLSGTELCTLYGKNQADITEYTTRSLLSALETAGIFIPAPILQVLNAASNGDKEIATVIADTLDADDSVEVINAVLAKGERALDGLLEYAQESAPECATASGAILNAVLDKMEDDQLEDHLFSSMKTFDTNALIARAHDVVNQPDAWAALVNDIKDSVLRFILEILPTIRLPKIVDQYDTGIAGLINYTVDSLDLGGICFRMEDVEIVFPQDENKAFGVVFTARNVSATFNNLLITFEQLNFPYVAGSPVATSDAQGISLDLEFSIDRNGKMDLSRHEIAIESLTLTVDEMGFAFVINALATLFSVIIKDYIRRELEDRICVNVKPLIDVLNAYIEELPEALRQQLRSRAGN